LVAEEPARELDDASRRRGPIVVTGKDAPRPEHVVRDEKAPWAKVLEGEFHRLRVAVLVDVVVDDVPRSADAAQRGRRLFAVVGDAIEYAGARQESFGEPDVVGGRVGAMHDPLRTGPLGKK